MRLCPPCAGTAVRFHEASWVYSTTSISGYRVTSQKLIRGGKEREIASLTLAAKPTAVDYELWALTARLPRR